LRVSTAPSAPASLFERRSTVWVVGALIALLFCVTNLPWQLDDYDQAKQAFTSFEMVNEGHWLYQHTPNQKVATKPPLVGWVSAAIYGLTRWWELAWRLPSLIAAFALLLLLARNAAAGYGALAGVVATAAFGLNLLSPRLATLVRTDMPLALVIFLLGAKIWQKVRAGEPWSGSDRLVFFALLTATMLVKGPIVYAFLLPGIVVFELTRRGDTSRVSAWCGWWPWVASLAVFVAWAAGAIAWVPGFYEQVVLREFAGRFGETVHRPQPLYFYFPHLLHKFAPWSVLMIALAVLFWKRDKADLRARWRALSPGTAWLICWSIGGLLLMSFIPSKRVDRIFPIVPPLCLLLAAQVGSAWRDERMRKWTAAALVFACLFTTGYAAQRVIGSYRADRGALAEFGRDVREEAARRGWRYEVVGRREEGLLLYLRRTRFLTAEQAIERWNAGELDALIVPADEMPRFPEAVQSGREATITINGQPRRYVLLTKP
jgi:4-amino-4-deoxy-L-arabinose transferase-like glycosyltransferase